MLETVHYLFDFSQILSSFSQTTYLKTGIQSVSHLRYVSLGGGSIFQPRESKLVAARKRRQLSPSAPPFHLLVYEEWCAFLSELRWCCPGAVECGKVSGKLGTSVANPQIEHNEAENQGTVLSEFSRSTMLFTLFSTQVSTGAYSSSFVCFPRLEESLSTCKAHLGKTLQSPKGN